MNNEAMEEAITNSNYVSFFVDYKGKTLITTRLMRFKLKSYLKQ